MPSAKMNEKDDKDFIKRTVDEDNEEIANLPNTALWCKALLIPPLSSKSEI